MRGYLKILHPARAVAKALGVDRAIAYVLVGRAWSLLAGPITLLLVSTFLSPQEQGYYYTFGSVAGLQVFFELGLSAVLFQFASHEKAELDWCPDGTLQGPVQHRVRLATLLHKSTLWYGALAAVVFLVLLPVGLIFFDRHQAEAATVNWRIPWIWTVSVVAGTLLITPIATILEGCGLIVQMARLRSFAMIASSLVLWLVLVSGGKLFAASATITVGLAVGISWVLTTKRPFLEDMFSLRRSDQPAVSWRREIWPLQWKIAISGVSSYFIFSLFAPVLFAFQGPIPAGQVGMSLMVMNLIATLGISWVTTKAAPFGHLIAKRRFNELDQMFFPAFWMSLGVVVIGTSSFWLVVFFLYRNQYAISQRLLAPLPLTFLLVTTVANHALNAMSVYLRAHKREPYLILSIASALLIGASTYLLGRFYNTTIMLAGATVITVFVGLGMGTLIFLRMRRTWHAADPTGDPRNLLRA